MNIYELINQLIALSSAKAFEIHLGRNQENCREEKVKEIAEEEHTNTGKQR